MVVFARMLSLYLRAKIHEKVREGASARDLAAEFKVHVSTIYWVLAEGERRRARRGRPLATSSYQRQRILTHFLQNPFASSHHAPRELGIHISPSTVRRILHAGDKNCLYLSLNLIDFTNCCHTCCVHPISCKLEPASSDTFTPVDGHDAGILTLKKWPFHSNFLVKFCFIVWKSFT